MVDASHAGGSRRNLPRQGFHVDRSADLAENDQVALGSRPCNDGMVISRRYVVFHAHAARQA